MNDITMKYGFEVGKCYRTNVEVIDEYDVVIPVGTLVRIVAIVPKIRITEIGNEKTMDSKQYFYNAVLATQVQDYGNRIRANFVTLNLKEKKKGK